MTVRAKFRIHSKRDNPQWGAEIEMSPVYDGSEENKKFFAATPSGSIRLVVNNDHAANAFEVNKEYYVDFTPA